MDGALARLLYLRLRGGLRYRLKQLATLRGILFLLAAAWTVWLIVGAGMSGPAGAPNGVPLEQVEQLRAHLGTFLPMILLGAFLFTALASSGPALHFSAHEINFLFAGPFSRRSLVLYKIGAYAAGAVLSAAVFMLFVPGRAGAGVAAYAGSLLTLLFVQLSAAAINTFAQAHAGHRLMRARRPVTILVMVLAVAAVLYGTATTDRSVVEVLTDFRQSWSGAVLLAPFAVFANLFLAEAVLPDLALWSLCAIAINAGLLMVVIRYDGRAADHALLANHRLSNRWARMRHGASFWASQKTTGRSLRRAPLFGGLGPVVWRQAINAVRNSGRVILVFFAIAVMAGLVLARAESISAVTGLIGMLYFFFVFMMPRSLVCDFRCELGAIELYKALPVAPWRLCAAQVAVPALLASVIQMTMIFTILLFSDTPATEIWIAIAALTLPANLLLYGLENLIFLLFPAKLLPVGRADFEFIGRMLVDFVIKTVVIVSAAALACGAGIVVVETFGQSWTAFAITSWMALGLIALSTIPLLAVAFRRFRVSETIV